MIPVPVMGGILCLLFGSIAVVGLNTLIRHQVDLSEARNLVIVSVTLVFGILTSIFASVTVVRLLISWWLKSQSKTRRTFEVPV